MSVKNLGRLPSKDELLADVGGHTSQNYVRFLYWQQIAETFMAVVGFESAVINAITMCDEIRVNERFGQSDSKAFAWIARRKSLEESTLGNLIKILSKHGFETQSVAYLKWVKDKRDYFVHRHFQKTPWPADLHEEGCEAMIRRLKSIEIVLDRASHRIWKLFEREGLLIIDDLGDAGAIIMPANYYDNE